MVYTKRYLRLLACVIDVLVNILKLSIFLTITYGVTKEQWPEITDLDR